MKASELMIGDWVRFRYTIDGREKVKTFRISQIENELGEYYVWGNGFGRMCHPDRLEPIPITPEILEKNGFENDFYEDVSVADYHSIRVEGYSLRGKVDGWDDYLITSCNGIIDVVTDFHGEFRGELLFVHELQRALRCCKLNELANNFII